MSPTSQKLGTPDLGRGKKLFWVCFLMCLFSGVASSGAHLGFDRAGVLEQAMVEVSQVHDLH